MPPAMRGFAMNLRWKWVALGLALALLLVTVFAVLLIRGIMDFGMSVL